MSLSRRLLRSARTLDRYPEKGYAPPVGSVQRGRYIFYPGTTLEPMFTVSQFEKAEYSTQSTGWGNFERCMATVESMTPECDWALGTQFTAADVVFGGFLDFAVQFQWLKAPSTKAAACIARIKARPAYRASHDSSWHLHLR